LDLKVNNRIIKKVKHTKQQSKLSKLDREKNLENSFKINKKCFDTIK
jgi:predicted amidophosphoribosyltransferase